LVCVYCGEAFTGEGINRLKQYLAQTKKEVKRCCKYPPDVHHQMFLKLQGNVEKKK
jgi:hypothetical protein